MKKKKKGEEKTKTERKISARSFNRTKHILSVCTSTSFDADPDGTDEIRPHCEMEMASESAVCVCVHCTPRVRKILFKYLTKNIFLVYGTVNF